VVTGELSPIGEDRGGRGRVGRLSYSTFISTMETGPKKKKSEGRGVENRKGKITRQSALGLTGERVSWKREFKGNLRGSCPSNESAA